MKKLLFLTSALIMSTMMWAGVITISPNQFKSSYGDGTFTIDEINFAYSGAMYNGKGSPTNFAAKQVIQLRKSDKGAGEISNTDALSISQIAIYLQNDKDFTLSVGDDAAELAALEKPTATDAIITVDHKETGTIDAEAKVYTFTNIGEKKYFQFLNGAAASYVFKIEITTDDAPQRTLESIYIAGEAENLEYFVGEEFDHAGLKVMGKYDDELGDAEITSGITWSYNPEVFALGNISVEVTATYKEFTSEAFTVNNIVVSEKPAPSGYAETYTSNVELVENADTKASAAKVIIDKTEYDAIKAGTGSVQGACVVTIPANTKTLHFHAVGWKDKNVTLDVNGTEYPLVADAGATSNSPFTLQNDPATVSYFTFDPKGATTITFTVTNDYRFILFGVNAEENSATAMQEVMENANVSKQLINGQLIIIRDNVRYNVAGQQL